MKESFKVGDIVYHDSGRICNGKYGLIGLFRAELTVVDNEGALDMAVEGNEDHLKVVGNINDNPELLEEFV